MARETASASSLPPTTSPRYRRPAIKRTWFATRDPISHAITFAPLIPGPRPIVLHKTSSIQSRLLELLDGTHTLGAIRERVLHDFPQLPAAQFDAMLAQLDRVGLLEEMDVQPPADWSPEYSERYSRHVAVFSGYERPDLSRFEQQRRLRDAHVTLLGVGGVGSWIALLLAQLGVGHLTIIDFDILDSSNLTRHALYTEQDIGRSKAEAAAERLHALNSAMEITTVTRHIKTEDEFADLATGADLFIISVGPLLDELSMRMHRACFHQGVPYISLAGPHLGPLTIPGKTACFECVSLYIADHAPWQAAPDAQEITLGQGYYAIFAPIITASIGLGIIEAAKFLAGFMPSALENGILYLNMTDLSLTRIPIPRNPACSVCGMDR